MPENRFQPFLNEREVAESLKISVASLRRWRLLKRGPKYRKLGASVRYATEDITRWVDSQPSGGENSTFA